MQRERKRQEEQRAAREAASPSYSPAPSPAAQRSSASQPLAPSAPNSKPAESKVGGPAGSQHGGTQARAPSRPRHPPARPPTVANDCSGSIHAHHRSSSDSSICLRYSPHRARGDCLQMFLKGKPEEKGISLQQIQTVPVNVETIKEVCLAV
mgnify:CR=1 FL=1